jgi:hypothetical protein
MVPEGLGVWLAQEVMDDGVHTLPPDDFATIFELVLTNLDFAPTLLDYAGLAAPADMQGVSGRAMLRGETGADWQGSFYYRY